MTPHLHLVQVRAFVVCVMDDPHREPEDPPLEAIEPLEVDGWNRSPGGHVVSHDPVIRVARGGRIARLEGPLAAPVTFVSAGVPCVKWLAGRV